MQTDPSLLIYVWLSINICLPKGMVDKMFLYQWLAWNVLQLVTSVLL